MNPITKEDDKENIFEKIKNNNTESCNEALGRRKVQISTHRTNIRWYITKVKNVAKSKREGYSRYRSNKTQEEWNKYIQIRNKTNTVLRNIKRSFLEGNIYL